jgi:hypothetical protein
MKQSTTYLCSILYSTLQQQTATAYVNMLILTSKVTLGKRWLNNPFISAQMLPQIM